MPRYDDSYAHARDWLMDHWIKVTSNPDLKSGQRWHDDYPQPLDSVITNTLAHLSNRNMEVEEAYLSGELNSGLDI